MSSSEEDTEKFQECVFTVSSTKNISLKELPSNRKLKDDQQNHDYRSLRVTPTFQKHVSKHLEALLDNTKFVKVKKIKKKKKSNFKGGIHLLQDSNNLLDINENVAQNKIKPVKRMIKQLSDIEMEIRAKEVAVTGEYILSKREIKNWAPETKGILEIIKGLKG